MTDAVTAPTTTATSLYSTPATRTPTQAFDSQMFLKLLVTQLQNQDPSSPMDSTQMISQTSQLASMQQLTSLNSATTDSYNLQMRSAAANVLGKTVSWTDAQGAAHTGLATAVSFSGSTPSVTVGSDTVALTDLTGISTTTSSSATTS
ncbi:flagellar hook capping FlgD N-terminal domain-containing protein [Amnibacterium sp.]|uniref:flagellar hook assembly protein FlgD n=1 Tax=Amnibacterium sp. TaxID=1872496 RepID=UPI0026367A5D|nr:flagellar hook capping FlgD N-terminal domain-containing protein [Amnibacterium sp.]MCU1475155.1 flagellar hook capping protein [Amnibacterium sp.]